MVRGSDGHVAPQPVAARDLGALVGLLAVLEGELAAGELPDHHVSRVRNRFVRSGLIDSESGPREVGQALSDLNHRLRYSLGEFPEPPRPSSAGTT
jgi:hypothetical protein